MAQVELTVIEQSGVEVTVLDAPGAQVAVGPTLSAATPEPVGQTGAAGTATSASRADHVHAHGNQTGTSLHALATTSGAGFMSAAQFNLLDGATDADTASTLVKRDASGDFEANQITAELVGNAATATALETARTINGVSFDGTANITITATPTAGSVVDASVDAAAAIAGSKISPDFGAQNVLTTGTITGASLNPTGTTVPAVGVFRPATNELGWATNTLERMRLDSSGRLLVGASASTNFLGLAQPAFLQSKDTLNEFALGLQRATDDQSGPNAVFRKTRSTSDGGVTIVQNDDIAGVLRFVATDGVGAIECAGIRARVNGNPAANDMPGLLAFLTTPTGSGTSSERLRINAAGNVLINNTTGTERLSVTGNIQLTSTADSYKVGTDNVIGSRKTGWAAPTGTATRTTFATYAGQDVTDPPTEAEVQNIDDHVKVLSERLKALIDDLTSHGLIGPTP